MKVRFSYFYDGFKTTESKVYGKCNRRFPSGMRACFKVWNNDRKCMEWIKVDACEVI